MAAEFSESVGDFKIMGRNQDFRSLNSPPEPRAIAAPDSRNENGNFDFVAFAD
jgi:hypothetical protein